MSKFHHMLCKWALKTSMIPWCVPPSMAPTKVAFPHHMFMSCNSMYLRWDFLIFCKSWDLFDISLFLVTSPSMLFLLDLCVFVTLFVKSPWQRTDLVSSVKPKQRLTYLLMKQLYSTHLKLGDFWRGIRNGWRKRRRLVSYVLFVLRTPTPKSGNENWHIKSNS